MGIYGPLSWECMKMMTTSFSLSSNHPSSPGDTEEWTQELQKERKTGI